MKKSSIILACDVGGTNTSIAAVHRRGGNFHLGKKYRFSSAELHDLVTALSDVVADLADTGVRPDSISISGAGPVKGRYCHLSNVPWNIDGDEIEAETGKSTRVINDFTAISFGIPLLDRTNPVQLLPLPRPDGVVPLPDGSVRTIVGAGTGLGVGYIIQNEDRYSAFPSEGGHSDFAPSDDLGREMWEYLRTKTGKNPGAELFVSGQGLANTLAFFQKSGRVTGDSLGKIDVESPDAPQLITRYADEGNEDAGRVMEVFIHHYARFASNAALHFFPGAGLYLAGGIATKNTRWFYEDARFMRSFLLNYRENIARALQRFPVYIVRDYDISLYGAAHAAYNLEREEIGDE